MTITNKSGMELTVFGKKIRQGQTRDFSAKYDSGIMVFSDAGCCKIYVEEGIVKFKAEENLDAKYGMKRDKRGHKSVNIYAKGKKV